MMRLILAVLALTVSAMVSVDATTPSCASMSPPPIQSDCCSPMQIIFMMDNSLSIHQASLQRAYKFAKMLRCSFSASATNLQLGMVSYNSEVKVVAPLQMYTETEWYNQVNTVFDNNGNIPQTNFTPMAEAFALSREMFTLATANTVNPNCTAKEISVQRVLFVFTDGNPVQNLQTPDVPGFSVFPTAWRVANQDAAAYAEVTVPGQAKLLRDMNVRVVVLILDSANGNNPHATYFATLVGSRKCDTVRQDRGFGTTFCKNKLGLSTNPTQHQKDNSQCYWALSPTTGTFVGPAQASGWVCKYRNPDNNNFPIASTASDVFKFQDTTNLANDLLTRVAPDICPNECFLQ